jgi:hypothetical protein
LQVKKAKEEEMDYLGNPLFSYVGDSPAVQPHIGMDGRMGTDSDMLECEMDLELEYRMGGRFVPSMGLPSSSSSSSFGGSSRSIILRNND